MMQPPRLPPLRAHLEALCRQADIAKANHEHAVSKATQRIEMVARQQTDYVKLVGDWYASQPPATRQRLYSIEEFVFRFAGRYRARPAIRLIAAALRLNGFTEKRQWTRASRNRRMWAPPKD